MGTSNSRCNTIYYEVYDKIMLRVGLPTTTYYSVFDKIQLLSLVSNRYIDVSNKITYVLPSKVQTMQSYHTPK